MEKLSFKTNINCNNCIAKVKPFLNQVENIENWQVDINNADKILSVSGEEELTSTEVIEAVQKAGFKIEEVN
ncbi:heavy-metal-associated domain-containing protein [Arcicella rigui]|uniref:Heavy-metal-associated domain-containing protein n=1 Tax=Arcicella rigui TaxID=797020 RepID=A0ABU5Q6X9_9BACT|nr:heavy-metal-associated domain-containing protein [Arcicella rigui]MEA5138596.1 heavy-metal-associated domain-containing protein [Arcicella rigui]